MCQARVCNFEAELTAVEEKGLSFQLTFLIEVT